MLSPMVVSIISAMLAMMIPILTLHTIEEGHVGVYFRAGALLPTISKPGIHLRIPFLTSYRAIQVTVHTDEVTNVPCGTSGGVMIYFDRVEIINKLRADFVLDIIRNYTSNYDRSLIFDKIHHELSQFCSHHTLHEVYITHFGLIGVSLRKALQIDLQESAPGLDIIDVRVTKPTIPVAVADNYKIWEVEKIRLMVSIETKLKRKILEKEAMKQVEQIENKIQSDRSRSRADSELYTIQQKAIAHKMLLTPEYLELKKYEAITSNNKIYFGKSLPNMFVDNGFVTSEVNKDTL